MAEPIDRIRAKVTRAKENIEDFQLRVRAFYGTHPYTVGFKEDAQTGKRTYYLASIEDIPLSVETVAADALGDLREAIDHLAYQLELAACGAEPKHPVYFPIADSAAEYPTLRARYIRCAGQAAIDAIDATEPYKGGKGHGLWQLNTLKKADKHRLLVATRSVFAGVDLAPTVAQILRNSQMAPKLRGIKIPSVFIREVGTPTLKVGDELYGEPLDHEVEEDRQFAFDVAFDKPGVVEGEPALKTLQDLTNLVDGLVTAFAPLLP